MILIILTKNHRYKVYLDCITRGYIKKVTMYIIKKKRVCRAVLRIHVATLYHFIIAKLKSANFKAGFENLPEKA